MTVGAAASPYKGLVPFSEEDAEFFFGREREREVVIANLKARRVVVLYGASGVGKSSLLRAGVHARLREAARQNLERLGTPDFLPVVFSNWRADPVAGLIEAIRAVVTEYTGQSLEVTGDLAAVIAAAAEQSDASLLLILDQFEEYTLSRLREEGEKRFAHDLPELVNSIDLPVRVLISLRDDALATLDQLARRIPALWETGIRIDPLTRAAARTAIEQPLERYNARRRGDQPMVSIEQGLTDEVLDDIRSAPAVPHHAEQIRASTAAADADSDERRQEDDAVEAPYLQVVMTRLWEVETNVGSRTLRRATFAQLGGVARIFETHLEHTLTELSSTEREAAADVFQYLVTPSGMKITHDVETLASWSGHTAAEVQVLFDRLQAGDKRILRGVPPLPGRDDVPRYEIFQDVLGPAILDWVSRESKARLTSPIREEGAEYFGGDAAETLAPGIALCLSGGGYRAMLFHVGALWRLNELGFLPRLDRVSSVSGGSITAAMLGLHWDRLQFDDGGVAQALTAEVVAPLRRLACTTIDRSSVIGGILQPRRTVAEKVAAAYRKHLFDDETLQELPDRPRFVISATNVQTGSLWRFSKPYMADSRVGVYPAPRVELAVAVGASSALPPVLSPVRLSVDATGYMSDGRGELFRPPFTTEPVLTDGGVYDNLGLETAWKRYETVLVSDGGGQMAPEGDVHADWARHGMRVNTLVDNQLRSLRKRQTIEAFKSGRRTGAYWGIRTDIADYGPLAGVLPCPFDRTQTLAATRTRLERMADPLQEQLINWGYAVCDAAVRRHVVSDTPPPAGFPYPARGVG